MKIDLPIEEYAEPIYKQYKRDNIPPPEGVDF
jgi:hypothetical protein